MKRRTIVAWLGLCALATTAALRWSRRADPAAVDRFVKEARDATRRYSDRQAAIDDGFTRVGVEFPAMGEHWVSFARVLGDSFSAARPSVLIYARTDSGPRLAGVAYTALLHEGDRPPGFPGGAAWHEHNGEVDEESLPLRHGQRHADDAPGPRLAILHAWIWQDNPAGVFATDNWALPLQRWQIRADGHPRRGAVQALAMAEDRDEYLRMVLRTSLDLSPTEDSAAAGVIAGRAGTIARLVTAVRASRRLSPGDEAALDREWDALWTALVDALPGRTSALQALKATL